MNQPTEKRYRGDRKATNILLSEELANLAKKFFPSTRHKNLSGFVDNALKAEFRKSASKIRGSGLKVPESVLAK